MHRTPAGPRRLLVGVATLVAAVLVLGACTRAGDAPVRSDGEAPVAPAPGAGGQTAVWGHTQEPLTLNPTVEEGNRFVTAQVALATLLPLWTITPDFGYEPTALLERATPSSGSGGFAVSYELNPEARWSDGTPITAGDVFFTLETCLDERWAITSRTGCEMVDMAATAAALEPDGKAIRVAFTEEHAAWRTLFSTADGVILPAHILEGQDWDETWRTDLPIASGPFRFEAWEPGRQLTMVRNEDYAGAPPHLERLVLVFLTDDEEGVQALQAGAVDLFAPAPSPELTARLEALEGVELQVGPGPIWEHLAFHLSHPVLAEPQVRRAIGMGIDREALVADVIGPIDPDAEPLGSLVHLRNHDAYEDHISAVVPHDPAGAVALLEDAGCQRRGDGVFTCDGEPLAFPLTAPRGDQRRERTLDLLVEQLARIGVEVAADRREPAAFFDEVLPAGTWELSTFAWVGGPDPGTNVALWSCDGPRNHTGHCDERVSAILAASDTEGDPARRARLVNQAGRLLARSLPALPLYQLPGVLAVDGDALVGPQLNTTQWGPVWNVATWEAVDGAPAEG